MQLSNSDLTSSMAAQIAELGKTWTSCYLDLVTLLRCYFSIDITKSKQAESLTTIHEVTQN